MKFKTKPFQHQLDCFEINKDLKCYAYLMEMGTGKSKVLLDTIAHLYDRGVINAALIIANKGAYMNWPELEIPTHMPDHIERKVAIWKSNMNQKEQANFLDVTSRTFNGLKIMVMNVEALAFDRSFKEAFKFTNNHKTLVAIDESTTIKNPKAKRTQSAILIGSKATARRIMTGSVVDNRPLDAYSQFDFLSHGCLGYTSFYAFRNTYAELAEINVGGRPRPVKVIKGYKNITDLKNRIGKYSFICKKEDCLDLPPKIYQKYSVEMTPEQKKLYEDLKKRMMTEIKGQDVTVKIVLTKLMRLHQLVCGHLKDDEGGVHEVPTNKLVALTDILDETSGQVIIWANYREDIQLIERTIKKEYGEQSVLTYYGDTDEEERSKAKDVFRRGNDTQGVRFLVGNPQTGGFGITLTGANTVIYYSNSFDAEKRNQSEDRAHRIGQTDKVTYVDIVCKETIDEKILEALKSKKDLAQTITATNWVNLF
jgi:SNF2 family DNA or RNA helicase